MRQAARGRLPPGPIAAVSARRWIWSAPTIFVEADGDRVRLGGFTDFAAERARAAEIARHVPGVAGVESQIRLR